MMAVFPAIIGLWISFFALIVASRNQASKKFSLIAIILSGVALGGAYLLEGTIKDKVAKDEKFEQKIDQTAKDAEQNGDLDDALDELE
jgi:ABC-type Fe3+-siderophore transport system permease subunit